jgi:hypothetical protein
MGASSVNSKNGVPGNRWWKRLPWRLYQPKGLVHIQTTRTARGETWIQLDYRNGVRVAGVLDPQLESIAVWPNPLLDEEV